MGFFDEDELQDAAESGELGECLLCGDDAEGSFYLGDQDVWVGLCLDCASEAMDDGVVM